MHSSILNATVMARLNETNYLTWNVHMRVLLIHSDLWSIMSGMEAVPDAKTAASMEVEAYALCQLKAAAKIALYVDDSQIIHVQGDDPKVIWNTLASIHCARGLSIQLVAMRKFSRMEKHPKQSITSWVGDIEAQAYLMKDIGIKLPDLLTIVVLTSGLPPEYDSVVITHNAVKPNELTLDLAISCLLNEEECHLSHKQLDDYKASLIKGESDNSDTAFTARSRANITCFKCRKKGHYAKDCLEKKEHANLVEEAPDAAW
jgi:hypothetical protein